VWASGPTAGPAHASVQLIDADLDATLPSLFFLGRRDPTDPFVSRQCGDFGPETLRSGIGFYGFAEICWQFVHRAARDPSSSHTSNRACFAQRDGDKPRQGTIARLLAFTASGAVGFIDWLACTRLRLMLFAICEVFSFWEQGIAPVLDHKGFH
jgi:hypothetical protein